MRKKKKDKGSPMICKRSSLKVYQIDRGNHPFTRNDTTSLLKAFCITRRKCFSPLHVKPGQVTGASMDFVRDQGQPVWTALRAPMAFGWRIWKISGLDFLDSKAGQLQMGS